MKTIYVCSDCGYSSPKWLGRCPSCGNWNTMEETAAVDKKSSAKSAASAHESFKMPKRMSEIASGGEARRKTGMAELDRVLGGGIVRGSLILVGGDPGIGKSTLLLQICANLGKRTRILYVSGEESESQIKLRAERLGADSEGMYLISETDTELIEVCIDRIKPEIVIIDSIQTMRSGDISSAAGSVSQLREVTRLLMNMAKRRNIAMFIVGHVTKDGAIAGPRVLEHMVDCVLYFEGEKQNSFRILRGVKNRFGSTNEIGVFEMSDKGLREVENPSAMLLEGRPVNTSGSCIVCAMEGSRGVLAEVQALVTPTGFGNPRRIASGIDVSRVILLIAVLEKRVGVQLSNMDVYVNIAGGLRIDETSIDLGICAAIVSGLTDIPLRGDIVFIGEVGLGGELRNVAQLEKRVLEAAKLGFKCAVVSRMATRGVKAPDGFTVFGVNSIAEAMSYIRRN